MAKTVTYLLLLFTKNIFSRGFLGIINGMEGNFEGNFVSPAPELHFSRTLNHRHTFRKCIKCNPALENGQVEFIGFEVDEKHFMDSVGRIKFYLNKDI